MSIKSKIRTIPNYPKDGIMFRDISSLLSDADGFIETIETLANRYHEKKDDFDFIIGIESRGFILGAALALKLEKGFIMVRKPGKLPGETIEQEYELEYGMDKIEIQKDAFKPGSKILLVDDLIATGGTLLAAIELIEKINGEIFEISSIIDLPDLGGNEKIQRKGYQTFCITEFAGE